MQIKILKYSFEKVSIVSLLLLSIFSPLIVFAALSCSVTTAALCTGGTNNVILRMSATGNAHAELPSQSGAQFANNVICCSGLATLGNSCVATNKATVLKLQAVSNSHVEQNNQSNFSQTACISDSNVADTITIAYTGSCAGYDTTIGSISAATNAHVGDASSFATKICGSISVLPSLTFSNDDAFVGLGSLSPSSATYANGANTGSITDVTANTFSISTNGTNGYTLSYFGDTLKNGSNSISATTIANSAAGTAGQSQFAMSGTITGTGSMTSSYNHANSPNPNWNFAANTTTTIASSSSSAVSDSIAMHYLSNIPTTQTAGSYTTSLTFVLTGKF